MRRLNRLFLLSIAVATACSETPNSATQVPERETIAIRYVAVPRLELRREPDPGSDVVTTYRLGEPVSILAFEGEWAEIHLGLELSAWAHTDELSEAREMATSRTEPTFIVPPSPVFSPGTIHGKILLEATINTEGEVTEVRTIRNTTGSKQLEQANIEALRAVKFHPLIEGGTAKPFIYEHRISY